MKFKRGDRVEINERVLEAYGSGQNLDFTNLVAYLAPVNPNDPVVFKPLRNFDGHGRNWPMEGTLGWVTGGGRPIVNGFQTVQVTTDQGHVLLITENALTEFP